MGGFSSRHVVAGGLCILTLSSMAGAAPAEAPNGFSRDVPKVSWGNPDQPWGRRRKITAADLTAVAAYRAASRKPALDEPFSAPGDLKGQWRLQSDDEPGLKSCRRPANVVIAANELQLRTLAASGCKSRWSTGSMIGQFQQRYGFFEARIKAADVSGINNAFWLVTKDHFEIDVAEVHYPNIVRVTLHNNNGWDVQKDDKMHAVGFNLVFTADLSRGYHDYGVVWTPQGVVYEVDGDPVAAINTNDAIKGAADIRFSTAVTDYAGLITRDPAGHHMYVRRLIIRPYDAAAH